MSPDPNRLMLNRAEKVPSVAPGPRAKFGDPNSRAVPPVQDLVPGAPLFETSPAVARSREALGTVRSASGSMRSVPGGRRWRGRRRMGPRGGMGRLGPGAKAGRAPGRGRGDTGRPPEGGGGSGPSTYSTRFCPGPRIALGPCVNYGSSRREARGPMRILIADDNNFYRRALQLTLEEWGYEVVSAADGLAAWEVLGGPNPPKLAILDWEMPGLDGPELCRRVRGLFRHEPTYLILLTSKAGKENAIAGLDSGADDYVIKPFD